MSPRHPENEPRHELFREPVRELGRQIEEAAHDGVETAGGAGDPAANPVERGLHELGQKIDAEKRGGRRQRRRLALDRKPRGSKRRATVWVLGVVGLVVTVLAGATAGYAWYLNHEIHRIALHNLTSAPGTGADANTENILMIGSTSRCALKVQNPAYGLCSQGVDGVNSDVVMILHLNPANGSVSILSVPRDLFVPNARSDGANKIDAALYQGPDQLIDAIEEDLGIPIQHFVELNFDSFINIVQSLGGIKMYFPEPVYDAYSGLDVRTTGCVDLNGTQALQVVRARHLQYKGPGVTSTDPNDWPQETQSDIARIRRDHEFLRVLADAVKQRGLGNPITDQSLVSGVVGQLTVDSGFSASDMINLVLGFHNVDVSRAPQLTVPVAVDQFGSYVYQGGSYGDIEFPAEPQDRQAIHQFLGLSSSNADTYSGGTLPAPSSVTVSVLNGSGVYNQATDTAAALGALGFHIGTIGDSPPVGQEAETVVYYSSKTPAELGGPGGGQLHVGRRDHGRGPDAGPPRVTGHGRHGYGLLGQPTAGRAGGNGGRRGEHRQHGRRCGGVRNGGHEHDRAEWHDDVGVTGRKRRIRRADEHGRASGAVGPALVHPERRRWTLTSRAVGGRANSRSPAGTLPLGPASTSPPGRISQLRLPA